MTTITTVRAALRAITEQGMNSRSLYQLGTAMGPATLYVAGYDTPTGFEPLLRPDSVGRNWLLAFTVPHPRLLAGNAEPPARSAAVTGAELLRLASSSGSCLVLEAGSPLECRIPPTSAPSLQVAAEYTEMMVADPLPGSSAAFTRLTEPRSSRERLAS